MSGFTSLGGCLTSLDGVKGRMGGGGTDRHPLIHVLDVGVHVNVNTPPARAGGDPLVRLDHSSPGQSTLSSAGDSPTPYPPARVSSSGLAETTCAWPVVV